MKIAAMPSENDQFDQLRTSSIARETCAFAESR